MPHRKSPLACLLLAFVAMTAAAIAVPADAAVSVTRKKPVVKYAELDPQHPPKFMPHPAPGEDAVCASDFGAGVRLSMQPTTRRLAGGRYQTAIAVDGVQVELDLTITVYLPTGANDKLKAHEEGHRRISEKVYAEVADRAAKVAGDALDGQRFEGGEAATAAEADRLAREAVAAAQTAAARAYLEQTSRAGTKVQDEYDALTAHGTRRTPDETEAIRQAWDKFPPPLWVAPPPPASRPVKPK